MTNKVIEKYDIYHIEVGRSLTLKDIEENIYLIRNIETGVVEAETSSLPRAIITARSSELALLKLDEEDEPTEEELAGLNQALEGLEDDGNGGQFH